MLGINVAKSPPPDHRRRQQILPPRPLVLREKHRAILDADLDIMILRQLDDRQPNLQKTWPVIIHTLRPIPPHERVHILQPEHRRRLDHLLQMIHRHPRYLRIRIQRIRIIP